MGILFAVIAFFQAANESVGLTGEQASLLFLQKLSAVEHFFFPFSVILLVIGIILLIFAPRNDGEVGLLGCIGGFVAPLAFFIALGTILPMVFTGWALGAVNPETGAIVNPLIFWGSVALYILTSWT